MPNTEESKQGAGQAPTSNKVGEGGADTNTKADKTPKPAAPTGAKSAGAAVALLKEDHRRVESLFSQYESASDDATKSALIKQICAELTVHTTLEEEIFYPACRKATSDEDDLDEAQVEHDSAKILIAELMLGATSDEFRDAKVSVLAEQIKHHVAEEEEPGNGIMAKAQAAGIDTAELKRRLEDRKQALMVDKDALKPGRPRSFQHLSDVFSGPSKEDSMARNQSSPDRDERGRFTSDDDDRRSAGSYGARGGGGRTREDDDGDRRYSRGRDDDNNGRGWYGDPSGHSQAARRGWEQSRGGSSRSDEDDRRYARGRDDDDNRPYSRGRDDGDNNGRGWYGDSRGHSEAARRGWDNPDHGPSGWFGDREGHAQASRSGWGNPDHGPSGWYGDSRGHSEASRRGWDDRDQGSGGRASASRYEGDRSYRGASGSNERERDDRGRFRDDDGDRRNGASSRGDDDRDGGRGRSGGQGRGGWFGDPEGHAQAARHRGDR